MSRPVLPSQNSRYWGHDLNNYLLSLASDIDEVNRRLNNEIVETNTVVLENVGFVTGTYNIRPADQPTNPEEGRNGSLWKYTKNDFLKSTTKLFNTNADALVLSGTVGFQLNVDNRVELKFKPIEHTIFSSNSPMIATYNNSGDIDLMSTEPLSAGFYNVFIYYDRESDSVQTVLSQQMLVNPCMILVGTLDAINYSASKDNNEYIFVPRVFSASKPLLSSIKDCLEPKTSIIGEAVSGNYLPLINVPYYMMINGIYPNKPNQSNEILNNPFESQDCKKIIAETDPEGWYDCYANNLNKLEISSSRLSTKSDILRQCQYDLYLSISGKIFSFRHNLNNLYTDYNVQSKYDLRFLDELRAGGLVYVGTYYSYTTQDSNVFSSAQTGGIPPVLNATQYNWNKIVLEDKEFHSIDEERLQPVGIRDFYLENSKTGEGKRYYLSTVLNSVTPFTVQIDHSFNTYGVLEHELWNCVYSDPACQTPVQSSASVKLTAGQTYYLQFTEALQTEMIDSSFTEVSMQGNWTANFTKTLDSNKYKIRINPEENVQNLTQHTQYPGYGVINLNLPKSNNLMMPVFSNSLCSTTDNRFKLYDQSSNIIIGANTYDYYDNGTKYSTNCHSILMQNEDNHTSAVISSDFIQLDSNNSRQVILYAGEQPIEGYSETEIRLGVNACRKNPSYNYLKITDSQIKKVVSGVTQPTITFTPSGGLSFVELSPNIKVPVSSTLYAGDTKVLTFQDNPAILIGNTIRIGGSYSKELTEDGVKIQLTSDGDTYCNDIYCKDITCESTTYITASTTSDRRCKTNIKPISASDCLRAVKDLNIYTYSYIDVEKDSLGMMAQDIEQYLPEYAHLLVHEDSTGKKHVEEHKLLFILWQAVKELLKEKD